MKALFVTQEYCPSRKNGAQHYSASIVDALIGLGVEGTMLVLRGTDGPSHYRGWHVIYKGKYGSGAGWIDNLSRSPRMVASAIRGLNRSTLSSLASQSDIVFIDHLACAGVIPYLGGVPYVYVAHNDEVESKRSFISLVPSWLRRSAHRVDLWKIERVQSEVETGAAVVTAISERDYSTISSRGVPNRKLFKLEPWRSIAIGSPDVRERPAVIAVLGTFEWTPKRIALWRLIEAFTSIVAKTSPPRNTVKLRVAGRFHAEDEQKLGRLVDNIEVCRDYESAEEMLRDVRIGLLIDGAGTGFKIKMLDYLQNGCAIYSLKSDVFMSDMLDDVNCRTLDGLGELVQAAVEEVMDGARLAGLVANARRDFARLLSGKQFESSVAVALSGIDTVDVAVK